MKYLYPYECEKKGLSSPSELQAAIDSNRREGRRHSYGANIFNYSPVGPPAVQSPAKIQLSHLAMPTYNTAQISQVPAIKKGKLKKTSLYMRICTYRHRYIPCYCRKVHEVQLHAKPNVSASSQFNSCSCANIGPGAVARKADDQ